MLLKLTDLRKLTLPELDDVFRRCNIPPVEGGRAPREAELYRRARRNVRVRNAVEGYVVEWNRRTVERRKS